MQSPLPCLELVPDCHVAALGVGLHGAGLLRDLHCVLHGLLKALGLPLHHLTLVLGANLSLDLSFNIQITLDTLSFFTCPHWVTGKPLSRVSSPTKDQTIEEISFFLEERLLGKLIIIS